MVQSTKENGNSTKQMAKASFGMLMAMYMKVIGKMIKLMAMESMSM